MLYTFSGAAALDWSCSFKHGAHQDSVHEPQREKLPPPRSCQPTQGAAAEDDEEVDGGCCPLMQRWADLLRCGSDWRSAMLSTGDAEASHVAHYRDEKRREISA